MQPRRLVRVHGTGMLPAFRPGQRLCLGPVHTSDLRRGDLVLVRPRAGSKRPLLKRLIGLPGKRLELRGALVLVDGQPLQEPYVDLRAALQPPVDRVWDLGRGDYVVLGDARDDSRDSRAFGPVRRSDILAAAACDTFPYFLS